MSLKPPPARPWLIALGVMLTMLAGYIDALGFIRLGGLFTSFMSGNTTQLGVRLGHAQAQLAMSAALVILAFALGACIGGAAMAAISLRWRAAATLALEAAAIVAAYATACLQVAGPASNATSLDLASAFLGLGMGAQNAVLAEVAGFRAGATFVTGALFSTGQKLGRALTGRGTPFGWIGDGAVWLAFLLGAFAGTLIQTTSGPHAFAVPACVAGATALAVFCLALRRIPLAASPADARSFGSVGRPAAISRKSDAP